jgi:hypothetical protein
MKRKDLAREIAERIVRQTESPGFTENSTIDVKQIAVDLGFEDHEEMAFSIAFSDAQGLLVAQFGERSLSPYGDGLYKIPHDKLAASRVRRRANRGRRYLERAKREASNVAASAVDPKVRESMINAHRHLDTIQRVTSVVNLKGALRRAEVAKLAVLANVTPAPRPRALGPRRVA